MRRSILAIIKRLAPRVAQNNLDLTVQWYQQAATARRRAVGCARNPHVSMRRAPMQAPRVAAAGERPERLNAWPWLFGYPVDVGQVVAGSGGAR